MAPHPDQLRQQMPSLCSGATPTSAFSNRPPSPPYIHIPSALVNNSVPGFTLSMTPSYDSVDTGYLAVEDLDIITGGKAQQARDTVTNDWRYESRRKAQPILDFLYLGPLSVVRDRDFLQREGITMLLAVRDADMANARIMSANKAASELGLERGYVDVKNKSELISSFPEVVKKINDHLLRVYKSQAQQVPPGLPGHDASGNALVAIDKSTFKRGKVLVFCETGNDRSAAVVAAYLMSMYERNMISVLQFISAQRFCTTFDEETKHLLRTYGDILEARRMVAQNKQQQHGQKRGVNDTMDEDQHGEFGMDIGRYEDRQPFAPFVQAGTSSYDDDNDINMH